MKLKDKIGGAQPQRTLGHMTGSPGARLSFDRKEARGQGGALTQLPSILSRSQQLYPGEQHPVSFQCLDMKTKTLPLTMGYLWSKYGVLDFKNLDFSPCSVTYSLCVFVQVNLTALSLSFLICKIEIIRLST